MFYIRARLFCMSFLSKVKNRYRIVGETNPFPSSTLQKPVYHGTTVSFKQFEKRRSTRYVLFSEIHVQAQGFFFTEDPLVALEYVVSDNGWVVECRVDMRKPLLDPRKDKHLGVDALPEKKKQDLIEILSEAAQKHDGGRRITLMLKDIFPDNPDYDDGDWIYEMVDSGGLIWDVMDNEKVVKKMQQLGYDGTFVHEDDSTGRSIFVPSEKQIEIVRWIDRSQVGRRDDEGDDE